MRTALPSGRPLPSPMHQPTANRWLAAPALGIMVAAPLAPRIVERVGTKHVVGVGLGIAATSMLALSRTSALTNDALLEPIFVAFGVGMGLTMAPATESIMGSVPRDRAGVGSAVNDTTRQAGGALGAAVQDGLRGSSTFTVIAPTRGILLNQTPDTSDVTGRSVTRSPPARGSVRISERVPPFSATRAASAGDSPSRPSTRRVRSRSSAPRTRSRRGSGANDRDRRAV